jgi:hypothetical protein
LSEAAQYSTECHNELHNPNWLRRLQALFSLDNFLQIARRLLHFNLSALLDAERADTFGAGMFLEVVLIQLIVHLL